MPKYDVPKPRIPNTTQSIYKEKIKLMKARFIQGNRNLSLFNVPPKKKAPTSKSIEVNTPLPQFHSLNYSRLPSLPSLSAPAHQQSLEETPEHKKVDTFLMEKRTPYQSLDYSRLPTVASQQAVQGQLGMLQ